MPLEPFIDDPAIHTIYIHKINYSTQHDEATPWRAGGLRQWLTTCSTTPSKSAAARMPKRNGKRVIVLETHQPHPGLLQSKAAKKRYFDEGHLTGFSISRAPTP